MESMLKLWSWPVFSYTCWERHNVLEIKLVDRNNFTRDSLKGFRRYQEVKNVYRLQNGKLTLVSNPFTEDWDDARLIEKAEEILSGRYVTYCAFEGEHVVGEIMLIPGLNKGRLIIDSFHVSRDYRLSSDPVPSLAEAEPYDLQMECNIKRVC